MDLRLISNSPGSEKDEGREGRRDSVVVIQPAGGQSSEEWEACLHPRATKKLAPRGLPSTKVYHFTAVEILTSILK